MNGFEECTACTYVHFPKKVLAFIKVSKEFMTPLMEEDISH